MLISMVVGNGEGRLRIKICIDHFSHGIYHPSSNYLVNLLKFSLSRMAISGNPLPFILELLARHISFPFLTSLIFVVIFRSPFHHF